MPGKGELQLTGQMGDVMKESAHDCIDLRALHLSAVRRAG